MNDQDDPRVEGPSEQLPAGERCSVSPGSASPADDYEDDDFDNGENRCHVCLGDGYVFGDELDDPDWYEPAKTYRCPCCNGSGDAKDCTYW